MPEQKRPVRNQNFGDSFEDRGLCRVVEIEKHISTKNDVEIVEPAVGIEQVELAERNHPAEILVDAPAFPFLCEVRGKSAGRKPALYFILGIDAEFGPGDHF